MFKYLNDKTKYQLSLKARKNVLDNYIKIKEATIPYELIIDFIVPTLDLADLISLCQSNMYYTNLCTDRYALSKLKSIDYISNYAKMNRLDVINYILNNKIKTKGSRDVFLLRINYEKINKLGGSDLIYRLVKYIIIEKLLEPKDSDYDYNIVSSAIDAIIKEPDSNSFNNIKNILEIADQVLINILLIKFYDAIKYCSIEIIKLLLDDRISKPIQNLYTFANKRKDLAIAKLIFDDKRYIPSLYELTTLFNSISATKNNDLYELISKDKRTTINETHGTTTNSYINMLIILNMNTTLINFIENLSKYNKDFNINDIRLITKIFDKALKSNNKEIIDYSFSQKVIKTIPDISSILMYASLENFLYIINNYISTESEIIEINLGVENIIKSINGETIIFFLTHLNNDLQLEIDGKLYPIIIKDKYIPSKMHYDINYPIRVYLDEPTVIRSILNMSWHDFNLYYTPLTIFYMTINQRLPDTVMMLIVNYGIDPTINNNYLIGWAAGNGYLELVKFLLTIDNVDPSIRDNSALRMAYINKHEDIIKYLLSSGKVDNKMLENIKYPLTIDNIEHIEVSPPTENMPYDRAISLEEQKVSYEQDKLEFYYFDWYNTRYNGLLVRSADPFAYVDRTAGMELSPEVFELASGGPKYQIDDLWWNSIQRLSKVLYSLKKIRYYKLDEVLIPHTIFGQSENILGWTKNQMIKAIMKIFNPNLTESYYKLKRQFGSKINENLRIPLYSDLGFRSVFYPHDRNLILENGYIGYIRLLYRYFMGIYDYYNWEEIKIQHTYRDEFIVWLATHFYFIPNVTPELIKTPIGYNKILNEIKRRAEINVTRARPLIYKENQKFFNSLV